MSVSQNYIDPCYTMYGIRYVIIIVTTSLLSGDSSSNSETQYSLMQFLNLDMTGKVMFLNFLPKHQINEKTLSVCE